MMRWIIVFFFMSMCFAGVTFAQNEVARVDSVPDTTYERGGEGVLDTLLVTAKRVEGPSIKMSLGVDRSDLALIAAGQKMPQGFNVLGVLRYLFPKLNVKSKAERRRERQRRVLNDVYPD